MIKVGDVVRFKSPQGYYKHLDGALATVDVVDDGDITVRFLEHGVEDGLHSGDIDDGNLNRLFVWEGCIEKVEVR